MMHDNVSSEYDLNRRYSAIPVTRPYSFPSRNAILITLALFITYPGVAFSQVNNPAYADYLLVGQFGEICTMCEAIVLCEATESEMPRENIPADGSFTLYHFETRTFWSQIATIWEWFITNYDSDSLAVAGHKRPVRVFTVSTGHWSKPVTVEAHLLLDPATITIGDRVIDRVESRWLEPPNPQPVGHCQRLPLWDSLEIIAKQFPPEDNP